MQNNIIDITDVNVYNENMRKSIIDKAYFLSFIEADTFIDFGCADASLLKYIDDTFPDKQKFLLGYDISDDMINLANKKFLECNQNTYFQFTNNFDNLLNFDFSKSKGTCLILSSVIHEVYSYGDSYSVNKFWEQIFNIKFDYIVIRDLMPKKIIDRQSDINDIARILHNANTTHLSEFQSIWGNITNNKNLVHFLLKYKWIENWSREVHENYFPIYIEDFLAKIPNNFHIDYYYEFIMPQTQQGIQKDFNILLKDTTHFKCILRQIK